ncbi:MAG: thiamine pyrophosphate-dependent dehydrogenase E1 component subunit alpha [Acetobacteraceae bacterium]
MDTEPGWRFLERMLLIRRFEEAVGTLAAERAFPGHYHLYIGQEATGVGAIDALLPQDRIATTHRNHGHILARGADPTAALAEILGRETGLNRGRGGTIHLSAPDLGFISTSGIVGSVVGLAAGAAFACKREGKGAIAVAFFGDGALEEGIPFEAMNLAALWKLPLLLVCENNSQDAWGMAKGGYPTLVHASQDLRAIPGALGIPASRVEGVDPFAVRDAVSIAAARCRDGEGPVFLECMTRRWPGSNPLWPDLVTGLTDLGMATGTTPVPGGDHHAWFAVHDPVLRLARQLGDAARLAALDARVSSCIAAAREAALASPLPAPATARDFTFA